MKAKPSAFLFNEKPKCREIIERLSSEFQYVSILGTDVTGNSYQVGTSGSKITESPDIERGFVLRVFHENEVSEYSFSTVEVEDVIARVRELVKEERACFSKKVVHYPSLPKDEPLIQEFFSEFEHDPSEDNPQEIIAYLTKIHDDLKPKYEEIIQLSSELHVTQVNKMFLSKNRDLYQSYVYSVGLAVAVSSKEDNVKQDYGIISGLCGSELMEGLPEIAENSMVRAIELLDAKKIVPGEYDIICEPDFTGLIAHEAFGHGAEMDMFVKDRAKGQEYVNQRVASDYVNMHDGATATKEVSSYLFDDEGNLGTDTLIIEKGILKTGMCDELSALLLDTLPTGNGKRESYQRKSYTRMTNTFFDTGEDSLEEMIASIEHGYLLEGLSSGMEDPKNWGIQCEATKGREIKNGKLTGVIVSPVYLTGYVPDLLKSITMVSKDLKMNGGGYCGKGWKEWVKTSTGGSYIKAKGRLS